MSINYSEKNNVKVEGQVHIAYLIYIKFKQWMGGRWIGRDR